MPIAGLRIGLALGCAIVVVGGCAGVPPTSTQAQSQAKSGNDEYEGWLFKSLTGRKSSAETTKSSAAAPSGVVPASATEPVPDGLGPWIAGPASRTRATGSTSGPDLTAGPPPAIPPELPSSTQAGFSIKDYKEKEEKKSSFEWSDLAPENIYKNIKKTAGYGPNEQFARTTMQEGQSLFREKKYTEAAAKFATAADRWPDTPLEEDALFLQAESEFFSDQYPKAHDTYGGLLKKYTNTRHLDTVMSREFALGRYWEQLYDKAPTWPVTPNVIDRSRPMFDTFGYAVQAYERIRMHDPTGPLADDSLMALGNAYLRRGQFEEAAYNYDLLIKEYPNSDHQMRAHELGLQAKMRVYQGTMYVGGPLSDAKKLADQTLNQYGDKLGPHYERIAQARAQIVEEQANRDFTLAQYYEDHQYYGAARLYYKGLIQEYPNTQKAKEAQQRLEAIRDKPDSPPSRFQWLTAPFSAKK
jgi:outer membrane protein assembly factor BamD (BamD/ComL family)